MAVQSFNLPVDFLNNLEKPIIYIAKQNKSFIGSVAVYDDLSLTFNLNAYQTATFKIYRDINGEHQKYFNDFTENRLIMIQGIAWYKIHVETNIENTGISKTINATSLECVLGYKRLINFQVNSEDLESDDDADDKYAGTIFYNPGDPNKSLLNRVLNVAPSWSVGHVDSSLANKQRTFDIDDIDVYSFLTGDVSEAFNCLFIFDTFNQTVSAYDLDNYGEDTSIYVSMDNLAQSMTESIDENSIITCYWVTRNDDVDISEVNPNGTRKIYNFEYFLPQMSECLQSKVSEYNKKYQSLKPNYEAIVAEMQTYLEKYQELLTRNPESATSEDWTLYGLYMLQDRRDSYKAIDETYCAQGMNKPSSIQYQSYLNNKKRLDDVNAEIVVRQSELNKVQADYEVVYQQLKNIQSELDMDKWFTKDDWLELDSYVIEETYSNDNFSIADNTDDSELFSVEKELYDAAWKDLSKKCRPQYQYSSTLSNILTIPQFKGFLKYFQLGNFIRMATDYDTVIKLRLISFTVDYNDTSKIDVVFSDAIRVHDIYDDASSIQAQANSAAMSFQFNKDQYDKSSKQSNWVAEMRKYGLDVATTQIHNAKNQSQTWDKTGMTFRQWNDQRNDFDPEQIKIINNMMVFLDGDGARMAIGKISLPNGNSCYGINCELLVNKLTMSENVWIENNSGTYKFDDAGFIASSGKNSVRIQPNNSGELFSIYKGSSKQVYINSDGDVEFAGSLKSASGQFAGLVSGGSIDIGNGTFTVDKNGKMTATSCNIAGNISSSNITSSSATFGGITLDSNGLSSEQFSIDSNGNASFSGTLSAASITSSGALNDYLTSSDLANEGKTTINGANITTGNISCDRLSGGTIKGQKLEGCKAEFDDGAESLRLKYSDDYYMGLRAGHIYCHHNNPGNIYQSIVFDNLMRIGVNSNADCWGYGIGSLEPTYYMEISKYGSINFNCYNLTKNGSAIATVSDIPSVPDTSNFITGIQVTASGQSGDSGYTKNYFLRVSSSGTYKEVGASQIHVSDRRLKRDITIAKDITNAYMRLTPVHFRYKENVDGVDGHWHYGFIAQDVKQAFIDAGIYSENEALVGRCVEDDTWLLDKDELHAMHTQMIQKQQKEIEFLKKELTSLEQKVNQLIN